jgi:hypothetical protein
MTDSEPHCTNRAVGALRKGYHIRINDRWLRIDAMERQRRGRVALVTDGGSLTAAAGMFLLSRDYAEQFYAVSALLPMVQRVKVDHRPLGNPFGGSRATSILEQLL